MRDIQKKKWGGGLALTVAVPADNVEDRMRALGFEEPTEEFRHEREVARAVLVPRVRVLRAGGSVRVVRIRILRSGIVHHVLIRTTIRRIVFSFFLVLVVLNYVINVGCLPRAVCG